MPCKSFQLIIQLDIELKRFLSYLNEAPYFNQFVYNNLTIMCRHIDRKKIANKFFDFMATYSVDRINFIYNDKILSRSKTIGLLTSLNQALDHYFSIKEKLTNNEEVDKKELDFYNFLARRWIINEHSFVKQVRYSYKVVTKFINDMISNYQSYIIKYLLKNRKGDKEPLHLVTDAYEVLMTIIDVYDYTRSKIPFFSMMQPYICNKKNKIIVEETWGLNNLVSFDASENLESVVDDDYVVNVDKIWMEVERTLESEQQKDDKSKLVELAFQSLPKPFKDITSILYELINPFTENQEELMALSQQVFEKSDSVA